MNIFSLIIEFAVKMLTGDVWRAWQKHKEVEAQNAVNKVDSLNSQQLDARVDHDIVRH